MKQGNLINLVVMGIMSAAPLTCSADILTFDAPSAGKVLADAQQYESSDRYQAPSKTDCLTFESLFVDILSTRSASVPESFQSLNLRAQSMGFTIQLLYELTTDSKVPVLIIREMDPSRNGSGIYFIRMTDNRLRPAIIECPHARSDSYTGQLGLDTFLDSNAAAFFCSTMRRNAALRSSEQDLPDEAHAVQTPDQKTRSNSDTAEDTSEDSTEPLFSEADPAHSRLSFFQAAHKAWMQRHPSSLVLQFHGFKCAAEDGPDRQFDCILSNGMKLERLPGFISESEQIVRRSFPDLRIGLSGRDTSAFGALMNVQCEYVNQYTAGFFWHIEMERGFRDKLMAQPEMKRLFSTCIDRLIHAYETI